MIDGPAICLAIIGAAPMISTLAIMTTIRHARRTSALVCISIGLAAAAAGGAFLAMVLRDGWGFDRSEVSITLGSWIFFSIGPSPEISIGLVATDFKAGMVSLIGVLALCDLWFENTRSRGPLSINALLATSGLYTGAVFFVLAPNIAQSLLGWGMISFAAAVLIRLSHTSVTDTPRFGRGVEQSSTSTNGQHDKETWNHRRWMIENTIQGLRKMLTERCLRAAILRWPNWLFEQLHKLDDSSTSMQLLATMLCAFAILLTWLNGD